MKLVTVTLSNAACQLALVTIGTTSHDLPPSTRAKIEQAVHELPERRSHRIVCTMSEAQGLVSFFTKSAGLFTTMYDEAKVELCRQAAASVQGGLDDAAGSN